jgi:deoxyribonuclease-4
MPGFKSSKIRLGVHTSIAGGFHLSIERAKKLGCTTIQIFSHNPRQWDIATISDEDICRFRELRVKYDINPVYIHASYLINLCSGKEEIYKKTIDLIEKEMDMADALGADYVVIHPGSSSDGNQNDARKRAISGLRSLSERRRWAAKVLLENTAGKRGDIASRLEELSQMLNEDNGNIIGGICIDTSHAYSAGYNLKDKDGLSDFIEKIQTYIGFDRLKLIHLNDSKKSYNSKVDRHEHIGRGFIGKEAMKRLLKHPAFYGIPVILETPKKSEKDDMMNLKMARSFYK